MEHDALLHYGIKGMKWGVRRYQNKDGSLTPKGEARYDRDKRENAAKKKENRIDLSQPDPKRWAKEDLERMAAARALVKEGRLLVDLNAAWSSGTIVHYGRDLARCGVDWLEEPTLFEDLEGCARLRRQLRGILVMGFETEQGVMNYGRLLEQGAVDILQPDIREEVKRTIFLHLKYSALGTIHSEMTAVKRFSRFLNVRKPELESLQELSREDIEDYLIYLQTETTERKNYRSDLYGLKRVIEDVGNIYERRHLLQLFLNNDFPSTPRYQFKFYSDATIKRLNSHIFNMDEQIARALIVHQLLGTRISDTLTLRMDCLREKEGRYFVRIDQVKSITYEKAVSNEVGRLILKAMEYTKERYGETEYVFVKKDDPTKPYQYSMIQNQIMKMIRQEDIRDDNGGDVPTNRRHTSRPILHSSQSPSLDHTNCSNPSHNRDNHPNRKSYSANPTTGGW